MHNQLGDVWGSPCIDSRILDLDTSWELTAALLGRFNPREKHSPLLSGYEAK
jgi:hypothetical protein